ncbi:MAG TPA: anti-sigma factor [Gaiellaceae bacterium]|nr:anti-sigma factor [Gaiellaceae bacterium]
MTPNFDEILGSEPAGDERERLRRVHELLVVSGPPPELTPRLEHPPETGTVRALARRRVRPRAVLLIAAALVIVAVVFGAGYGIGKGGAGKTLEASLSLRGTAADPHASATLQILPLTAGNWPMTLTVSNLRALPPHTFYEVYLVRNGKPYVSCGEFVVAAGAKTVTVNLNAPYVFRRGDSWIVTRETPGDSGPGQTVLKPVST